MRWEQGRRSQNVEDRRAQGGGGFRMGGRGLGLPMGRGGMSIGGLVLLVVLAYCSGFGPFGSSDAGASDGGGLFPSTSPARPSTTAASEAELADFTRVVLATTEDVWGELFPASFGREYEPPKLVLFRDVVQSACGTADSAVGPFYCPLDHKAYVDLSFYDDLRRRLGAPGDFAQAYVIAHEIGHHVQNLLGTSDKVQRARRTQDEVEANRESVKLELQADYFAGVWAHHAKKLGLLDVGDVEEALGAAQAIGDDRLQRRSRGVVVPDSFTHGTSEQRVRWFRLGFESGDPKAHDPFTAKKL